MNLEQVLVNSGAKFRKEILAMPVVALEKTLKHMTIRKGVRGDETVGGYASGAELRPYKSDGKGATDTGAFFGRTLTTYLGDVVEEFDPYQLYSTVYGESFNSLTERKEADVVRDMALAMAKHVSSKLGKALFGAARTTPAGSTTMTLFDGFDTIAATEITAGNIGVAKGNYGEFDTITAANAGDVLKAIYASASDELKESENLKMYVSQAVLDKYEEWCLATLGAVAYNQTYAQNVLHFNRNVEIVPMVGLKGSSYIYFSTKDNMLVGMDQQSDAEKAKIRECDNPKALQFFMCLYWGVQFQSIKPEFLFVAKQTAASDPTVTGDNLIDGLAATAGSTVRTYATSDGSGVTAAVTTEGATWLTVAVSGNKVTFTRTAYAHAESGDNPRIATVRVSAKSGAAYLDVTVKQAMASE